MTYHYPFGGSTAGRTVECHGWKNLAAKLPPSPPSEFAARGTVLHDLIERCVKGEAKPEDFYEQTFKADGFEVYIDFEEVEALQQALAAWHVLCDTYEIDLFDTEVRLQRYDDTGGTVDLIGIGGKHLIIADWKFGQGVMVSPVENSQMLFYAGCAFEDESVNDIMAEWREANGSTSFDDLPVVMAIIQPDPSGGDTLKVWETKAERVSQFNKEFVHAREAARKEDARRVPGDHCKFCPAVAVCPEKTGEAAEALKIDPESAEFKQLGKALDYADRLEAWIKAVRKMAHEQAERGNTIPGRKLVAKRATRKWTDEVGAATKLHKMRSLNKEDYLSIKLVSPAQLEKACKKKGVDFSKFNDYIRSVSSGTTLALEDDPRPQALAAEALRDRLAQGLS